MGEDYMLFYEGWPTWAIIGLWAIVILLPITVFIYSEYTQWRDTHDE